MVPMGTSVKSTTRRITILIVAESSTIRMLSGRDTRGVAASLVTCAIGPPRNLQFGHDTTVRLDGDVPAGHGDRDGPGGDAAHIFPVNHDAVLPEHASGGEHVAAADGEHSRRVAGHV